MHFSKSGILFKVFIVLHSYYINLILFIINHQNHQYTRHDGLKMKHVANRPKKAGLKIKGNAELEQYILVISKGQKIVP